MEQLNAFNDYRKPKSGPFSKSYNSRWRNYPYFSWKQSEPLNQGDHLIMLKINTLLRFRQFGIETSFGSSSVQGQEHVQAIVTFRSREQLNNKVVLPTEDNPEVLKGESNHNNFVRDL